MENEFAKNKSGVKEKKEHSPKAIDWQAYCEINTCSTNQWTDKLASLLWK